MDIWGVKLPTKKYRLFKACRVFRMIQLSNYREEGIARNKNILSY